ncbi:MAG TPA: hypothetical protein VM388_04420 [Acidimicrobiales bacterium]|nr:hypothetical protein [Acidimicrobiales bacterium]HWI05273.1 hypothetical protein [Acidimicrobiales bacterium]
MSAWTVASHRSASSFRPNVSAAVNGLALRADATLSSWGHNAYGEVGNGTTVDALAPVAVTGFNRGGDAFNRGTAPWPPTPTTATACARPRRWPG